MEAPEIDSRRVIVVAPDDPSEATVTALAGEHDLSTVGELARAIATVADAGRSDLTIDLSDVQFMDSTTIAQILTACTSLREEGRIARIRDPSPLAHYLLEICGLTDLVAT
jgi:anti-anti-sigma factor